MKINNFSSFWDNQSPHKRAKIIGAWQSTFVFFAIVFFVGGNLLCSNFNLSDVIAIIFNVLGGSSLSVAVALEIWGEILIYWDK